MNDFRIALVGDYPPPVGGIATHVRMLSVFLQNANVEVTVFDIGKGKNRNAFVVPTTPMELLGRLRSFEDKRSLFHFHTSGNNSWSWMVIALLATLARKHRRCVTLHSGLLEPFLEENPLLWETAIHSLHQFDRVFLVSRRQRRVLSKLGFESSRIRLITPFIPLANAEDALPDAFTTFSMHCHPLLAVAQHPSRIYGGDLVVEAIQSLRKVFPKIGCVFFGPSNSKRNLKQKEELPDVNSHFLFLPSLAHSQVQSLLRKSDVFLRPTLADGDSLLVREALSLGVRTVASDATARPPGTILFSKGNAPALASAVLQALKAPMASVSMPNGGSVLLKEYQEVMNP